MQLKDDSSGSEGKVTLSLEFGLNTGEKPINARTTVFPETGSLDIQQYQLTGTGPNGATASWSGAASTVQLTNLTEGSWSFTAVAHDSDDVPVASGSIERTLQSSDNSLFIELTLADGVGSVEIALTWPTGLVASPVVAGSITALPDGTPGTITFTTSDGESTATVTDRAVGPHLLTLTLSEEGLQLAAPTRVVWAFPNMATAVDINLSDSRIKGPPVAVTSLVAEKDSGGQITISWMDNSDTELGYRVYNRTSTTGTYAEVAALAPGAATFAHTGLTEGYYEYYVQAYNNFGTADSDTVNASVTKVDALVFADENLARRVRDEAQMSSYSDPAQFTNFSANNEDIADLSGIDALTNLTSLDLSYNQITDISPLAGLTSITNLRIYGNQIADLGPIAGMTDLSSLQGISNAITDLSPLASLTNLSTIDVNDNMIADLSPLAGLGSISGLYVGDNVITDVSPLASLDYVNTLDLSDNQITTGVASLAGWTSTPDHINLGGNTGVPAADVQALRDAFPDAVIIAPDAKKIGEVSFTDPEFRDAVFDNYGEDTYAAEVTYLSVEEWETEERDISSLGGIEEFVSLRNFYIYGTSSVSDLAPLSGLPRLRQVTLEDAQVSDLSPLSGLTNLRYIRLPDNQISNLSAFAPSQLIEELDLSGNAITDVIPLASLNYSDAMATLDLADNQITTGVDALASMSSFPDVINLAGNTGIPSADINALVAASPYRVVLPDALRIENVTFGDDDLKQAIADNDYDLVDEATSLDIYGNTGDGITSLEGLQEFTSLTDLSIYNFSTDVSLAPVQGLVNLNSLSFYDGQWTTIPDLSGLTNLYYLNAENNQITDISALASKSITDGLYLSNNQITDVSALATVTFDPGMGSLDLANNQITTGVDALAGWTDPPYSVDFSGNPDIPAAHLDALEAAFPSMTIIRP